MGKVMIHAVANNPQMAFLLFTFLDRPVYLADCLVSDGDPSFKASLPVRRTFSYLAH